jgi:hypothetical protein
LTSIPVPKQARQHVEAMCAARARGHWADELDGCSELIGSLDREQRKVLIPLLAQAG